MEDTQLLAEYSRTKSEQAFSQLVRRHLGLVLAAARRQVSDETLAEDVAQAVFLVLADRANSLGKDVVLAGWLVRTTQFIASRALRTEFRWRRREQTALAMQDLDPSESTWKRIAPHLDEALARLGELDRNALLLRFAEGCNHREVGIALGLSEEAAKKRVNRALDHLRSFFSTRGISVSVTVLAAFLTDRLTACSPEAVAISIAKAALRQDTATAVSVQLAKAMRSHGSWQPVQLAAVLSLMVPLLLLIGLQLTRNRQGRSPLIPMATDSNLATGLARLGIARTGNLIPAPANDSLRLRVVSKDSDEALSGAKVFSSFVVDGEPQLSEDLVTDAEGYCWVPIPKGQCLRMDIGAQAEGYAHRFITWRSDWSFPRPSEHVLRMSPAETIGGFVLNTQGNLVSDVVIWLQYGINENPEVEPLDQFERPGYLLRGPWARHWIYGRSHGFSPQMVKNSCDDRCDTPWRFFRMERSQ